MKKSTLVFVLLTGFASFCNYAIYPALSRVLSSDEFVDITVALALFTQLSSFMLAIVALTIGIAKDTSERHTSQTIERLQTILAHIFVVIIVVFLALSPFILERLQLPAALLIPICMMLALSLVMSVISGYLNGKQKLVKLGLIIAGAALLQLVASAVIGIITKNGVLALSAMALSSLASTITAYVICRGDNLPSLSTILLHKLSIYRDKSDRRLLTYTIAASFAALALNILLVLDLLIVSARGADAVLYTDMYIVSRIVFFAGMLLVWPFLSGLDLTKHRANIKKFTQLSIVFGLISIGACVIMYFYGEQSLDILLGSNYSDPRLAQLAALSITYKFIYLMLTTLCLIFIIYRSYWAIYTPIILATGTGVSIFVLGPDFTTVDLLIGFNVVALIGFLAALFGFIKTRQPDPLR